MKTGVQVLELEIRKSADWIHDVADRLHARSSNTAVGCLRGILHAIRDALNAEQAAVFAANLPLAIKGFWYEGWQPAATHEPAATREEFLARVREGFVRHGGLKAERAVKAALEVISKRVPAIALAEVLPTLPEDLRTLWRGEPAPYADPRSVQPLRPALDETRRSRTSPSRLRRNAARGPGEAVPNALPERRRGPRH